MTNVPALPLKQKIKIKIKIKIKKLEKFWALVSKLVKFVHKKDMTIGPKRLSPKAMRMYVTGIAEIFLEMVLVMMS